VVDQNQSVKLYVAIVNLGNYTEAFNVTAYIQGSSIITQYINSSIMRTPLSNGSYTFVIFTWSTAGLAYGNYTISAFVTLTPGETNSGTGEFTYGTVKVTIPGDINGDGVVNAVDFHILAANWLLTVPPANANADIGGYGVIGPKDFHILAVNWLKKA
jgi:hypothetical protein